MKLSQIISEEKLKTLPVKNVIGIDIGSRQSKAVLLTKDGHIYTTIIPTGFFMKQVAKELMEDLFCQSGLAIQNVDYIVSTGYGRIALNFDQVPSRIVTEISCHGMGAHYLGEGIHTIIDIGGQDSKAIKIDPASGRVIDFVMNDKCAAGTGRFLEKSANILGWGVEEMGKASLKAANPAEINSTCVVFAESEIISTRAKGVDVCDLAAGIHRSVAKRVNNLLARVGIEKNVLFTGGVSNNIGMRKAFEDLLGFPLETARLDTVFAGALGAAIYAGQYAKNQRETEEGGTSLFRLDITDLENAIDKKKEDFAKRATGKKKNVAYFCSYAPVEILSAANVSHIRLMHAGTQQELASGEKYTRSIVCDFTKGTMGSFFENNPLYSGIDKVYAFNTCGCIKTMIEAINANFVPAALFNLPRNIEDPVQIDYLASEFRAFKEDLEQLTGEEITEDSIREKIKKYNEARKYIRLISNYRKGDQLLVSTEQFKLIIQGYFYLDVEELLTELKKILVQLKGANGSQNRPMRIMIAGGITADGDHKITSILEKETDARIVIEDNCTGYTPISFDVKKNSEDVYLDLAEAYLGKAPCTRMGSLSKRAQFSADLAREYNVDGILYYYLKFCPCYGVSQNAFLKKYKELGIPVLQIPSDYSANDEGQVRTRIEAFIEMLSERNE